MEIATVMPRNFFALIFCKMTPPRKRPTNREIINTMLPMAGVTLVFSVKIDGMRLNMDASAPQ